MKDTEIPWPGKGDKAFKDVPFSPTGASPHWLSEISDLLGGDYQWAIVEGFKEAADRVVDSLAATKERMDVFFFPVVYLYRHTIELSLKGLVNDGIYLRRPGRRTRCRRRRPLKSRPSSPTRGHRLELRCRHFRWCTARRYPT